MRPIDERTLRASFINASRKEVSDITLPPGFADVDTSKLDYLGWVDPKLPRRSYVVAWVDDVLTGVILQRAEQRVIARAQCSWCEDVTLRNDVQLYVARKAGPAGRKGDTIGTLVCTEFGCSKNVRVLPPLAYDGYDRELAREMRIVKLQEHVAAFIAAVKG
ncbi:FBP domain-containing protein [Microbacterium sp. LWH13-1.2]|uniref:FBP domain-containing protein n=1 Tax=Microbacterium sp. LWH13-1.2 TaxID=3135260 RepID=UPI003138BE92